ncbi:MAG: transporter permease protein, partial [Glaciihabitans sp.]|nr:transporter permease protein [Glaciihabitans sp.]
MTINSTRLASTGKASRFASVLIVVLILALLLVFFVLPVIWLVLAPTKTAGELLNQPPLSFGAFSNIGLAFSHLASFEGGIVFVWLKNSAIYSGGSLILTLATSIPAGYALALTRFRGRKVLLTITLLVMIMPSASLVLPLFLELNLFGLIGTVWSIILPFSFFPFGVYLVYIYFATSL